MIFILIILFKSLFFKSPPPAGPLKTKLKTKTKFLKKTNKLKEKKTKDLKKISKKPNNLI